MLDKNPKSFPDYAATLNWLESNMPQTTAEIKDLAAQILAGSPNSS